MFNKGKIVAVVILAVVFLLPLGLRGESAVKINDVYTVVFVLDGLNYDRFQSSLKVSALPNIKKYFIDEGAVFENALTLFPSASVCVYQSIVSGLFPGHAGMPYLDWFDRKTGEERNYFTLSGQKHMKDDFSNYYAPDDSRNNIFTILKGYPTAAVYSQFSVDAKYVYPKYPVGAIWAVFGSGREEMLDKYAYRRTMNLFKRPFSKIPRFSLIGLYSFDSMGHHYGTESDMVHYNLEAFDSFLGEFIDLLKKRGIFKKTYIVLLADHGMHDVIKGEFDLRNFLKKSGLSLYPSGLLKNSYDSFLGARGIASAELYLKGNGGWRERPSFEEIQNFKTAEGKTLNVVELLRKKNEIKFVVIRDGDSTRHIFSKNGRSSIVFNDGRYGYRLAKGDIDPLEMEKSRASKMVNNGFFTADDWGEKTKDHIYPDVIVQLSQIFDDGKSGDIIIIANDDYVFYRGKSATHGSIVRKDMRVPLLMRGPTVTAKKFDFARLTDVYPAIVEWFGLKDIPQNDGVQKTLEKK